MAFKIFRILQLGCILWAYFADNPKALFVCGILYLCSVIDDNGKNKD